MYKLESIGAHLSRKFPDASVVLITTVSFWSFKSVIVAPYTAVPPVTTWPVRVCHFTIDLITSLTLYEEMSTVND